MSITHIEVILKYMFMPQRKIEGGKKRHLFIFCFGNWVAFQKKKRYIVPEFMDEKLW